MSLKLVVGQTGNQNYQDLKIFSFQGNTITRITVGISMQPLATIGSVGEPVEVTRLSHRPKYLREAL